MANKFSWSISGDSNRKMQHSTNVYSIIDAARKLFSEKYPHIINIANISYLESDGDIGFSHITFKAWNGESIVITDRRVYLNAADGIQYILLEYENDIEDICYCDQEDIQKKPNGPTASAKAKKKAEEDFYNNLMYSLGTMLPGDAVLKIGHEQMDKSVKRIADYLIGCGYVKEGCL